MNEILGKISDLSKSYESSAFLPTLLGNYCRDAAKGTIPVVLFGAGAVGKDLCEVLQLHGVQPVCFCDNNPSHAGPRYSGLPVISPAELTEKYRDHLVIVSSRTYASEIRQQLLDQGFPAEKIIPLSPVINLELLRYYCHCAYYTKNPRHALTISDLEDKEDEVSAACNLLADQKSRDIFLARLSLFISKIDYMSFSKYVADYSEFNEKERG